jgi:hypothetical protein
MDRRTDTLRAFQHVPKLNAFSSFAKMAFTQGIGARILRHVVLPVLFLGLMAGLAVVVGICALWPPQ